MNTARRGDAKPNGPRQEGLETPIQFCPNVGPRRAQAFGKLGVVTIRDLFWHIPRGYEDFHTVTPIRQVRSGGVFSIVGKVVSLSERKPRGGSRVKHIFEIIVEDPVGTMTAVWFNQPFLMNKITVGETLLLHGKVEFYDHHFQMSAPKFQLLGEDQSPAGGILPLYPLTEGLTQTLIRNAVSKALDRFGDELTDFLPPGVIRECGFFPRREAFRILHAPQPGEGAPTDRAIPEEMLFQTSEEPLWDFGPDAAASDPNSPWSRARRQLIFEELFLHQFILQRYAGRLKKQTGISHLLPDPDPFAAPPDESTAGEGKNSLPARFIASLPFELTAEQKQVCREIQHDLCSPSPMNRLLQGEVGAGKTVVSFYAMIIAAVSGYQAAMMAPTDLLANQHFANLCRFTAAFPDIRPALLTGRSKASDLRESLKQIQAGEANLVIGTHALFQERVEFARLGLVVVDEQHKFGVNQRQALMEKGDHPDLLVATATPIPRTLSLTLFGDMEISVIHHLPPGRPPLVTRWTHWEREKKVWEFVEERIEAGEQIYVVCPIIDPSENAPHLPSTEAAFERLSQTFFPHRRVAVLHGRHSAENKNRLMKQVREGEVDVIVATTVVEVGVDLPNVTVMVVLGAERFGLAQLHQLRGRVGRGQCKSYCILVTPPEIGLYAEKRMRVMEKTRDGFYIAEEDLKLRGPGEFFGTRQSGHLRFHLADPFRDVEILQEADAAAKKVYHQDPNLAEAEHQSLRQEFIQDVGRFQYVRPS